jgi:hypothetical protein
VDIRQLGEKEKTLAETVKIPKSEAPLKRPADKRHALLRIEKENAWIRSLNRELAETFCALVTRGEPVTAARTVGVVAWGTYAGATEETGTIILDRKSDGRFKLVPLDTTPDSLLRQVAHFVGRPGSLTSEEGGKHGLIFRGELRNPDEPSEREATAQEPQPKVAPAQEKTLAETVKIPKSKAELKRPVDKRHALLRIEKENAWIRSLNRELAETFCTLVTRGEPVTAAKTAGVLTWGTYAGEPDQTGTIILDRKSDGRFKLVPLGATPNSLLTEVAHLVGRPGSVTSEEGGQHGLIFRGELRNPGEPGETEATAQGPEAAPGAEAPAGGFQKITGTDAIAAIGQKVTMEFMDRGVKVRIQGRRKDCEETAKRIIKGTPTAATQKGAKYMIEGNLTKPYLRKGANQQGPDANGVCTREDFAERSVTAFGENLTAVQAACLASCKEGTMFTIVVNDRSAGHIVISSGRRRLL